MSVDSLETAADIGELGLIERLKPFCADVVGDDGALVSVAPENKLVVTTDVLVEGVHFSDRTTPPHSVGWRAAAANLSDLAAMGAEALGITVGLGLPPETKWHWVEDLYRGMFDCLEQYGGSIVGGDLCRSAQRMVSITALGQVRPGRAVYRRTARPGETVVVTGAHGLSRAGLALLLSEFADEGVVDAIARSRWIEAHQYPVPRFDAIAHLQNITLNLSPYPIVSGMDSSDGLANALLQMSGRSGVGVDLVRSRLPIPSALAAFVGAEKALDWTLYGGEDFELVLCLPTELADRFVAGVEGAIAVGTTTDTQSVRLLNPDGTFVSIGHKSFQHF